MIRIFISHKKEDEALAILVKARLDATRAVETYIDVLDPQLGMNGQDIGEYLQGQITNCTHLMAVVSPATVDSWWVPFEIGIATEHEAGISTFARVEVQLPSYLRKWPYLRTTFDLDRYVEIATRSERNVLLNKSLGGATFEDRRSYARVFHSSLRSALGQA